MTEQTAGEAAPGLARMGPIGSEELSGAEAPVHRWDAFPRRGGVVTIELIDELHTEDIELQRSAPSA